MPVPALRPPSGPDPGLSMLTDIYNADMKRYDADIKRYDAQRQEAHNRAKATVSSLISSYNSAKSQALQEDIINSMKTYQNSLPADLKKAIEPYIAHGPTSEMANKRREFLSQFPPPQRPTLNEASGEAVEAENKAMMIRYKFASADHNRAMQIFMGGEAMAPEKLSFIYNPDGTAAIRNKDGMINILSQQDLDLKTLEEKYNIPAKDIILNGGVIPTGKTGFMQVNGRKITTEDIYKPFAPEDERYGSRITNVESMPKSQWDFSHPAKLVNTMMQWKMDKPDDKAIRELKERALKSSTEAQTVAVDLKAMFPQYSFNIVRAKRQPWWSYIPFLSADDNVALIPIRGEPIGLPDSQGKMMKVWYDADLDLVSNKWGIPLGNYQAASVKMLAK